MSRMSITLSPGRGGAGGVSGDDGWISTSSTASTSTAVRDAPTPRASTLTATLLAPSARRSACPLASSCSCVFQPAADGAMTVATLERTLGTALQSDLHDELTRWTDLGYAVTQATDTTVVLERRRLLGFCVNAALTAVTGLLWLAYWIPRTRHPRFDVVTLTSADDGSVVSEHRLDRR
ncbi:hypothetical protein [Frondihabitans peucedani]